jgi:3D-(3,5/4)-trihydroxycyclohexane-1,2-dione acylhydrolase (decyclizing)
VIYSEATAALRAFAEATGVPVAETQAGKGSLPYDHPLSVGAVGSTGPAPPPTDWPPTGRGDRRRHRWSDFTTASRTAFGADGSAVRQRQRGPGGQRQARRPPR